MFEQRGQFFRTTSSHDKSVVNILIKSDRFQRSILQSLLLKVFYVNIRDSRFVLFTLVEEVCRLQIAFKNSFVISGVNSYIYLFTGNLVNKITSKLNIFLRPMPMSCNMLTNSEELLMWCSQRSVSSRNIFERYFHNLSRRAYGAYNGSEWYVMQSAYLWW